MMKIPLRYERFSIETELTPDDVARRLRAVTQPARRARGRVDTGREFYGWVEEPEFQLTRRIGYRNSFIPVIRGRIEETPAGSSVRVSLMLRRWVSAFMGLWFGLLAVLFVVIVGVVVARQTFTPVVVAPVVMAVLGGSLATFAFRLEARRARERLQELLGAEQPVEARPLRWFEAPFGIGWRDVRAAGPLGLVWVGCYLLGGAVGLYDWMFRPAGCTNQQAYDPTYSCPTDVRVFSVWALNAAMIATAIAGIWAIQRKSRRLLALAITARVVVILFLVWVANDPAFGIRRR